MKLPVAVLALLFVAPACAQAATVGLCGGDVVLDDGGATRQITQGGRCSDPVLSPDGHTVAYVHEDAKGNDQGDGRRTSLMIADARTGESRTLLAPRENDEPKLNMASFEHPRFSLDGGYVYVDADAWATSTAVHQVDARTGAEKFVIDGWLLGVLRNGPRRGYLLVGRHQYHPEPQPGSFNPVYVVRPDGKDSVLVPGSDKDDGERSLPAFLRAKGWTAS